MFSNEKPKSFQGPKVGPEPRPIRAHFICMTLLHGVSKTRPKKSDAPLNQILDPPLSWVSYLLNREIYHIDTFSYPQLSKYPSENMINVYS